MRLSQQYVKPFSYNTSVSRMDGQTDGRTDRITISISRVSSSMLMRDNYKNPSRFSRVMITNVLPPFYGSQWCNCNCIWIGLITYRSCVWPIMYLSFLTLWCVDVFSLRLLTRMSIRYKKPSFRMTYRVGQIKRSQLLFLLVSCNN